MKSRQKFTVSEKQLLKGGEWEGGNISLRVKKKNQNNPLVQKNAAFLHSYNNLFRKPSQQFGDSDTYFKQTLRSDTLDLIRGLNLDLHVVKTVRSFETLHKRKPRSKRTVVTPRSQSGGPFSSPAGRPVEETQEPLPPRARSKSPVQTREFYEEYQGVEEYSFKEVYAVPQSEKQQSSASEDEESDTGKRGETAKNTTQNKAEANAEAEARTEAVFGEEGEKGDITAKEEEDLHNRLNVILSDTENLENMEGEEEVDLPIEDFTIDEGDDDEIREVEQMIERAAEELQQVAEENQQLMETLDEVTGGGGEQQPEAECVTEGESTFKFDPAIDSAIMRELDDAEKQAKETANVIMKIKERLAVLSQVEKMTEKEALELEEQNRELEKLMVIFEERVKRIQQLIVQSNLFENMLPITPALQVKLPEDALPQVLICGMTEENMPKLIICDKKGSPRKDKKEKKERRSRSSSPSTPRHPATCTPRRTAICTPRQLQSQAMVPMLQTGQIGQFGMTSQTCDAVACSQMQQGRQSPQMDVTERLRESINMQEKLAAENVALEGTRYERQSELVNKDQSVDPLQRQLADLQAELRMVCQENCTLNQMLQQAQQRGDGGCSYPVPPCGPGMGEAPLQMQAPVPQKKGGCGKGRGICPADIESRLQEYSENTQNLERQLYDMEAEVREMQCELSAVQREREHLEHHRKMLCQQSSSPPCFSSPCIPPPCMPSPCMPPPCMPLPCRPPPCIALPPCPCDEGPSPDQLLKEMKEQYNLLQDDYKSKLKEVGTLRAENQNLKEALEQEKANLKIYLDKIKKLEDEIKDLKSASGKGTGLKEQLMELEQQLTVAKQRFREAQDELEELRLLVQDQQQQMDDYRNRYLEAQQLVEEQRRQIDLMEMENQRVSEQVNLEIQRVKNQFQEKVQELMPLPDILKSTQLKLQEAQQMHLLAERNNEAIARELKMYKDKLAAITDQLDAAKSDEELGKGEKELLLQKISEYESDIDRLKVENSELNDQVNMLGEQLDDCRKESDSRAHEIAQLEANLENVREESARQVSRTKDRCEIIRKSMQNQINDLERQLAQCRAQAKAAQKDRDEIRQKMQAQICNLNENFEDAQMRIRSLQGHVNFLKNTYGVVHTDPCPKPAPPDPCCCGADY